MAKFKPCNYDQMVMLPISLENQLVPGSLEHTINELVEKHIDLSVQMSDTATMTPAQARSTPRFCSKSFCTPIPRG